MVFFIVFCYARDDNDVLTPMVREKVSYMTLVRREKCLRSADVGRFGNLKII